ncbi:MAG: cation-translocating P-type ATPase [Kofleriaceae bacterium]|nr:MAG: cation-translocating P-type ATPase [Kofleriaceae bacterium]
MTMSAAPRGLTASDATARLATDGPNELRRADGTPAWRIFARQFTGVMSALLAVAGTVALALGEAGDAIAIAAILVINGIVGYVQEHRAERAILALRAMTAPHARVIRDGRAVEIPAREVVVGDVLLLEAGDIVAADAGLDEANRLGTNEAALTGESLPVDKRVHDDDPAAPLAERIGQVFMGTVVATGTGRATVLATGMRTQLGSIAHLLNQTESETTPLQVQLAGVGRWLVIACVAIVVVIAAVGVVQERPWLEVLLSSVSLAVAAVPEGMTAVVTIALAVGVQRMASRHVLVRRLPAVETLGCTTVICTDKTGTLTTGRMAVREIWGDDHGAVLRAATACCDAELGDTPETGTGDPTELAILAAARSRGIERAAIEAATPRRSTIPFDADRKRMTVVRADGVAYVKGAFDVILPRCRVAPVRADASHQDMAARGLRVLAIATGAGDGEEDLELVGLVGMADPPRTEAIEAIANARRAGIRTVMITGDHPVTARAIATELGLVIDGDPIEERVHARATPEDKLRIVRAWKERGEIVAMTGDGVNDAPALRTAHIGIAMGKTGTEVTREASSMILTDDNFASIIAAVREGRAIYDNIKKTLVYLLAGNAGELLVMLGAAFMGLPLPLLPLQILWINLVTDGFPALALVMDPPESDTLARPPRRPDAPLLGRREWSRIGLTGLLQATVTLATFAWVLPRSGLDTARNLAFSVLVFGELFRAFAARSETRVFWQTGVFGNLKLLGVIAVSVLLQLGIHHIPAAQALFGIGPISLAECGAALLIGLVPVTVLELAKLVRRPGSARRATPAVTSTLAGAHHG